MELIRGLHNIAARHRGCVLTIGNFDGVHLGHQAVLARVREQAERLHVPAAVMIFEPQPLELFAPHRAPARLSRWQDKWQMFRQCGMDRMLITQFNQRFASLTAEAFIEQVLVAQLGVKLLVVGDDFRFGKGRSGDFALLQEAGKRLGFSVIDTKSYRTENIRVSSTAIRSALETADFAAAEHMLGRPFSFTGRVRHGEKRGRTIGFPTANIALQRQQSPLKGVFAVTAEVSGKVYGGVANIGRKPTVNGERELLEVHLFGFQPTPELPDLYGKALTVTPLVWLRDEHKFNSFPELQNQIQQDAEAARAYLAANATNLTKNDVTEEWT
ncbi:riboflavin kinase/FMN adenylyltransferase [Idiomarina sp. A28L]|uniref:bifunctional riboflavin kinase/FAD synthetase n=1 Tax=Idiomarina sp. A28L TaxID=1036674 RepID=UPI0002138DE4|nr:bifunctional riboflavin kinase/FAD synthetase [Idiomarina sp. A28L]EGN74686.1 riboflavin kinase/FMN adenylyltransferase [Idiomarina sp. A28L]